MLDLRYRVNDILTWSSKNLDQLAIIEEEVDLRMLIVEIYEESETQFKSQRINLDITGDHVLETDSGILKIILRNALDNVLNHGKSHSVVMVSISKFELSISNLTTQKINSGSQKGLTFCSLLAKQLGFSIQTNLKENWFSFQILFG